MRAFARKQCGRQGTAVHIPQRELDCIIWPWDEHKSANARCYSVVGIAQQRSKATVRKSYCSHRNVPHLASLLHQLSRQNVSLMSGDNGFNAGLLPRSDLQNGYQPDASDNGNGTAAGHNLNGNFSSMRHREPAHAGNGTAGLDCIHASLRMLACIKRRLYTFCTRHHGCVSRPATSSLKQTQPEACPRNWLGFLSSVRWQWRDWRQGAEWQSCARPAAPVRRGRGRLPVRHGDIGVPELGRAAQQLGRL